MAPTSGDGMGPVDGEGDRCAVCGGPIPERAADGATAHWGGPGDAVIVAWTCGPACAETYTPGRRPL